MLIFNLHVIKMNQSCLYQLHGPAWGIRGLGLSVLCPVLWEDLCSRSAELTPATSDLSYSQDPVTGPQEVL